MVNILGEIRAWGGLRIFELWTHVYKVLLADQVQPFDAHNIENIHTAHPTSDA